MLFELCDWIKKGGALAPDPGLKEELCALRYVYQGDKFRVVPKDIIKQQIGRSPDKSDALGLTFAYPVAKGGRRTATPEAVRSEEHTSELQSLMRISYAVFCLKKKKQSTNDTS